MKKNVIILAIECLRPKNLSMFGYGKETDKHLKELSGECLLFTNYFSVSNATMPSISSIFSGKYPPEIGMVHQIPYVTQEDIEKLKKNKFWLPIYLRNLGYETISLDNIGLWLKRGFNVLPEAKESKIKEFIRRSFIRKILLIMPSWLYSFGKKIIKTRASPTFPPSEKIIDSAIEKIEKADKPFFMYMRLEDTHFPFLSLKKQRGKRNNEAEKILERIESQTQKEYVKKRFDDAGLYNMEDIRERYDSGLINTDKEIGRFVRFLKKKGIWKNTILVILGDHGENFDEHGVYFSRSGIYDTSIHTLLMLHVPGVKAKKIEGFAQNVDIAPTILNYLGEKTKIKLSGFSLKPLIKKGAGKRNKIFAYDCFSNETSCVRTKKEKLILSKNPKCYLCKANHHKGKEYYKIEKDNEEKNNLYKPGNKLEKFLEVKNG